jgi:hypothetical protein
MNNHRSIILLITLLGMYGSLSAQNICSQNLLTAQRKYDQGQLMEVNNLLDACLESGFSKAEKIQAYRLSILSLLFQDEQELAGELMVKLLKLEPSYLPNRAVDPSEFIKLYDSYRAVPKFAIGVQVGFNNTRNRILNVYSLSNTKGSEASYSNLTSLSLGITTSTALYKNLHLGVDILYAGRSYSINDPFLDFVVSYEERQNYLEIPVGLTYLFGKRKTRPFIQAGLATAFLLEANAIVQRNQLDGTREAVGPEFSVLNLRNSIQTFAFGSIGVRRKFGKAEVFAEARYYYGLMVNNNPDKRLSDKDLVFRYGHLDSDYSLNNLMISVGFLQNFYSIRRNKKFNDR